MAGLPEETWPGLVQRTGGAGALTPRVRGRLSTSLKLANPRAHRAVLPASRPPSGERRVAIGRLRAFPAGGRTPRGGGKAVVADPGWDAGEPEATASPGRATCASMDAAEVEFLAEKELVTIIPNFSLDKIYLIGVKARAGHLPQARAGGTGVWERPGCRGFCGRRLALLRSFVSDGKPGADSRAQPPGTCVDPVRAQLGAGRHGRGELL